MVVSYKSQKLGKDEIGAATSKSKIYSIISHIFILLYCNQA